MIEPVEARVLLSGTSYTLNTLVTFDGNANGGNPQAGLVADSSGNLYGTTTYANGEGFQGTVFEIPAGTSNITTLTTFTFGSGNGLPSVSPLIYDGSSHLYGTTDSGGDNGDGSVFAVDLTQSPATVTTLVSFDDTAEGGIQGASPQGELAIDSNGFLYGATHSGGTDDDGTIFKLNPLAATPTITTLASFDGTDNGSTPDTGLVYFNGNLYGTSSANPTDGDGGIFDYNISTTALTSMYSFAGGAIGQDPSGLIADSSGHLYGSLYYDSNDGAIFEIDAGTSNLTVLASLSGDNNGAAHPQGFLTLDSSGNIFGTSEGGGATGDGAIFEVDHTSHLVTTIASLDANTTGSDPQGGMALVNGNFFGTAEDDGNGGNGFGTVFELTAAGPPAKLAFVQQPASQVASGYLNSNVTVDVEDASGNIIQTDNSTVTLSVATPTGGAFNTDSVTSVQAVNGVATFTYLVLNQAGTYTLTATDTDGSVALTPPTNATPFTITHASADQLAFITQPSGAAEGTTIAPPVVVDVEDGYGNLVTNDASGVTLAIASGGPVGATLGGTATIAASGGVATFSDLSLADAGTYTLSATDGSLTGLTSNAFTITGAFGAAAKLVVASQPTDTTANAVISPAVTVEVEDANGNLVVSDTSSVTLQVSSGPTGGALSGTLTEPVINGVATFGDLSSLTAGTYVLTASDGALPAVATNSFLISPGDAAQVNLVNPPSDLGGGPTTVQAGVEDQYGNLVTGYSDPVTLDVSGPAGTTIAPVTVSAVNGLATFTFDAAAPGSYSFTINSGSFSTTTSSNPITLTYTQPTLVFSSPIDTIVAGQRIAPITLTLYNASGVITNSRPHVTLGILSGPGGGRLYGGVHAVGRNGQVTFKNLQIHKADPSTGYVLEASAVGYGTGSTNSFIVVPAAVKRIAFVQQPTPSPVVLGSPFSTEVALFDRFGNIETSDASSVVTLSLGGHPRNATFSSGVLGETDVSGVADFTDLILSTHGNYTFKAVDGRMRAGSKRLVVS